jgi:alkanesulfonate monooxygenase SsuD/methylene tetrahydromethanopterin reductase-like flavin-dependent oxidoreductase (luciferase family)
VRLGTGVVGVFQRGPALLAQEAAAIADLSEGRFVLGIGSSSNVIVERWNQIRFEKPLTKVRETVEALRPILRGERGPGGFKLDMPPAHPVPIYVGALRSKMRRLAGEIGDGAWLNFLPLEAVPRVVADCGDVDTVCRLFWVPSDDGLGLARFLFASYASVPVYSEFFRELGYWERIEPMVEAWNARERERALELVPDELVKEIFVIGDAGRARERVLEFAAAGITSLSVAPICDPALLPGLIDGLGPR